MSALAPTAPRPGATAPRPGATALLGAFLAVVAALAITGAVLAAGVLDGSDHAPRPTGPFAVAQDVPVSFGVIAVEHAQKVAGVSGRAVASADHGIPGFVPAGRAQLELAVTIRNTTAEPIRYSPAQFALLAGERARRVPLTAASVRPGRLEPGAAVDATLRFTVPARRERLRVAFRDPGSRRPVVIDLGRPRAGRTPARAPQAGAAPATKPSHGHGG